MPAYKALWLLTAALLVALLASSLSAATETRAAGLVNFPPAQPIVDHGDVAAPGAPFGQHYNSLNHMTSKIRILLTRNISNLNSYRLSAPDISYFGVVGFGSPAKMFNVVFDTGSSEIWIPYYNWFPLANNLHYSEGYSCKDSSSCVAQRREFSLDYRGTKLSGETYEDVVTLYEDMQNKDDAQIMISPHMTLTQNFLAIEDAGDEQFRYKPYDGVIGLAPVAQSSSGTRNFLLSLQQEQQRRMYQPDGSDMSQVYQQQQQHQMPTGPSSIPDNTGAGHYGSHRPGAYGQRQQAHLVFAFWFNPNQNSRHGGELMIGGVDENRFVGEIFFHRVISYFEWQLPVQMVMLGAEVISCPNGCVASLDTGANSLVGPRQDVESIYEAIHAQYDRDSNLWLVDCSRINHYPTVTIRIEDTPYTLYPQHYIKMFKFRDSIACYMGIKPWDRPSWLLGTNFISAYYTVFDFQARLVGFATPRV